MSETETSGSIVSRWGGVLWSIGAIVIPAVCWFAGIWQTIMLGAVIGATVRFGTDLSLMALAQDTSGSASLDKFAADHMPVVATLLLVQFGTLFAGVGLALSGYAIGIGIVGIMLLTYLFGMVYSAIYVDTSDDEATDDSEWAFDIEDV